MSFSVFFSYNSLMANKSLSNRSESKDFSPLFSYFILACFVVLTIAVTFLLYQQVQEMFKNRLQERLISIAATASVDFSSSELEKITGPDSVNTETYKKIVKRLQEIRNRNKDIKYIYILRKTKDANIFIFVADADSIDPKAKVDLNNDGTIDESDELNAPGDEYDVSEFTELREFGFTRPTVDDELTIDQWGTFLSSSAPIIGESEVNELIGIDVEVSDFVRITNLALIPFAFFIIFLLLVLSSLTIVLVKMWGNRVSLLKELDRQKDELLSIVSHQLATPITSVKWYLEMLMDGDIGKLTKEQEEHVKSMQTIALDLVDLVGMILDVSRIQLGKMKIEKQKLDLKAFFHEILDVIEPKATEKKINFVKNMPAELPEAMLDKRYTRMTVENLLSNAIKYTKESGNVTMDVKIEGNTLHCKVSDTGMGIPKEEQSKIFGRLFRASNARNAVDGNGFGLYVAKGAIEAQGGKIWFESEVNKGTTFFIELPLSDKA